MVYHTNSLQVLFDRQRPVSISGWGAIESDGRLQFICSPLEKLGPLEHCQNTKNTKPKKPTKKNQSEKNFWKNQPITKKSLPTTKKEIRWIFLPWSTKPWTSVPSFTKLKTLHLIPVLIILEIIPNVPIEHPQLNHGKMHQVKFHCSYNFQAIISTEFLTGWEGNRSVFSRLQGQNNYLHIWVYRYQTIFLWMCQTWHRTNRNEFTQY